jgi:SAM-dependent methyltransferase
VLIDSTVFTKQGAARAVARVDDERDAALSLLAAACATIADIERRPPSSQLRLLHATGAALHEFASALGACEAAGLDRSHILPEIQSIRALHGRSPFVHRLQSWPRGYPGDFETVEWMCDGRNHAVAGTLAWGIEQYALQSPIAQQHRNKVAIQARTILSTVLERPAARVASIGCGGCRDLRLIQTFVPARSGHFVLVDADAEALRFAQQHLGPLAGRCVTVTGKVPRVLPSLAAHGPFDLVVAGGLFDYLPDRWAATTLRECRRLLASGGRILFSNIAAGNPFRVWIEYLADWTLIERQPEDLGRLLTEAGFAAGSENVSHDTTGLALIAEATR